MVIEPKEKLRLVLIDGHALVYRAFFALPSLTDRDGRMVNAAYGFTSMLLLALQQYPDYVLASFDLGGVTFRHQELAQYKATRRPTPPELSQQIPLVRDIVKAFGIPIYEVKGVEADDVIGTLVTQASPRGLHSTIVTGDLDALQLVEENVDVLANRRGVSETTLYTTAKVRERYGLEPIQIVDLKALVGDTSDNIPGIPGVGEKTAIKLIQEFGTVENLIANTAKLPAGKVRKLVEQYAEQTLLSKRMATIVRDVDVQLDLSKGSARDSRPDAARTMLADLGFRSLAQRVPTTWRDTTTIAAPPILAPRAPGRNGPAQTTLALETRASSGAAVDIVQDLEAVTALAAAAADANEIGFQVVVQDEIPRLGHFAALVVALDADHVSYIPLAHEQEPALSRTAVLERLRPVLEGARPTKTGFNQKADILALRAAGIRPAGFTFDLLVAAYLLNSGIRTPSLEALASDVLHQAIEGRETLLGTGKTAMAVTQVEPARAASFFADRMRTTLALVPRLQADLERLGNSALFRELEMPLVPVLAELELTGVGIDSAYLQPISRDLYEQLQRLDQEIADVAHGPINVNSPQQLARFLFEDLALPGGRRTKSGYSTDANVLDALRDQHPVVAKVLEYRQLSKLKGTYVDALPLLVDERTHRVHTSFNQTVASTGRLSSSDPNLQTIPIRTDWGQRVRRGLVPGGAGEGLVCLGSSQIELRVLAHMT